jgi:putative ABC transport system permease protein
MGVLWKKILFDLWGNKGRTILVVLIIAFGAGAIGMILGIRNLVIPGMQEIWTSSQPAMLNLFVGPPVGEDVLLALKREQGVAQIEGLSSATIEWRRRPQDEWRQGGLTARADYDHQTLNSLDLTSVQWPEGKTLSVEDGSETFFGISAGQKVELQVNDRVVPVKIGGTVYNRLSQPAMFGGSAQFYSTQETYEYLVGDIEYNQIMINAPVWDEDAVTELADRLEDKLERQNVSVGFRLITDPNKHFFQDQMDGLFVLLGVMGVLALVLGLLLVYNTMNALIGRQADQIGVLKAVGARTWQILRLFLVMVLIYGVLALLVALPMGILGAWFMSARLVGSFGADIGSFEFSTEALLVMVATTLLAPLLGSIIPILSAARLTVREAISTYGLSTRTGWIERLGARLRFVSRMFLITVSNTFRNKWRVLLMEITLVLSGLIFMMTISVRDSVEYTVNDIIFKILGADITMIFEQPQRVDRIRELIKAYPGVRHVELWDLRSVTMRPRGQPQSDDDQDSLLFGVPLPTDLYGYQLRAGRWLDPRDRYAIVLNEKLAEEVGVAVGDWVTVRYAEKQERDWQVVGLVFDPILTTSSNAPLNAVMRDVHQVGRAYTVWISLTSDDPQAHIAAAKQLRAYFKQNGVKVSAQRGVFGIGGDATVETARQFISNFNFILVLLGVMVFVIGLVGAFSMYGAISLSVMERVREIGVMRAIGASAWDVSRLFIGEALILGWLSWLIALPLSIPAGQAMVSVVGSAFQTDFVYRYTLMGPIVWLVIISVVSIIASLLPAYSATRVSVRQSLAYQ